MQNFQNNMSPGNNQGGFNIAGMISQFNQFRQNFQGDPKQIVQQLLQSGQMSQAQYNQLSEIAVQFQKLLH